MVRIVGKMPALGLSEVSYLNKMCQRILSEPGVRFAGIINWMGNRVAGGFSTDIAPLVNEQKEHMMYMQLVLELNMRSEFDPELGKVNYLYSKRDNVSMISIPKKGFFILLATERMVNVEKLVELIEKYYSEFHEKQQNELVRV